MAFIDPSALTLDQRTRLIAAFVGLQGPIPLDGKGDPVQTPAQFAQAKIMGYILAVVKQWEAVESKKPTPVTMAADQAKVDTDFQGV